MFYLQGSFLSLHKCKAFLSIFPKKIYIKIIIIFFLLHLVEKVSLATKKSSVFELKNKEVLHFYIKIGEWLFLKVKIIHVVLHPSKNLPFEYGV